MKAVGTLNWDKVRDWLAEAGSACSGYRYYHEESPAARREPLYRERFDQPKQPEKAEPETSRVIRFRAL